MSFRIAIIGGGPGGLMTAYQLQQRSALPLEVTIYEASGRLGGKVLTRQFENAPVPYEAGAAELYDYSHVGDDPLRNLVARMGLSTKEMSGASVILDGHVLAGPNDVGRVFGASAKKALLEFDRRARRWSTPQEFYESDWNELNTDPMSEKTFDSELERVTHDAARRYLQTLVHSDLATEPHRTSAAYGLQNYLMNDPAYLKLYTIEGGIECLLQELAARVTSNIRLREPVLRVTRTADEQLQVVSRHVGKDISEAYDFVVAALPNNYLPLIDWGGGSLAKAMQRHHVHYDYPAHYLRISILFREVFWREQLKESYVMLDAFGGCCLYDEASRSNCGEYGVLGWLLAGNAAMTVSNLRDEELIQLALGSLPSSLCAGKEMFLEGHVHRWIGAVNGLPGGNPATDMKSRHIPEQDCPNLFVAGDYLFDSTLNGVLDSADYVAETLVEEIEKSLAVSSTMQRVTS